jgi:hypothetical protein
MTPKQRQTEKEADHEQEHIHMNGHNDPRCYKWEERRAPREARIRRVYNAVKRLGEMSELSTTERGSTKNCYHCSNIKSTSHKLNF